MSLIAGFVLLLDFDITRIILRVMYDPPTPRGMRSPNQAPPSDIGFVSLTRSLVDTVEPKHHCPECDTEIDFNDDLEWMGPTAFLCKACERVIELHRIENL